MEHVGDVAGGPGSHGVGAAIFDRFFPIPISFFGLRDERSAVDRRVDDDMTTRRTVEAFNNKLTSIVMLRTQLRTPLLTKLRTSTLTSFTPSITFLRNHNGRRELLTY